MVVLDGTEAMSLRWRDLVSGHMSSWWHGHAVGWWLRGHVLMVA